jgi:hypothetical protein
MNIELLLYNLKHILVFYSLFDISFVDYSISGQVLQNEIEMQFK